MPSFDAPSVRTCHSNRFPYPSRLRGTPLCCLWRLPLPGCPAAGPEAFSPRARR